MIEELAELRRLEALRCDLFTLLVELESRGLAAPLEVAQISARLDHAILTLRTAVQP